MAEARETLGKLTPAEVNTLEGGDVAFQVGDFTKGVPLGKRDFMGAVRVKT